MSAIRISRPKQRWRPSPATLLPTALLLHLVRPHWNYTVLVDDHAVGKIGDDQVRAFDVAPGEHRLCIRFVLLRRSQEIQVSLREGEERQFVCGTTGLGWPTLRDASAEDVG